MYNKFLIYLHLNGLHGEAKYYKYLMSQMDFENQVADEIRRFCETRLKPVIRCNTLTAENLNTLVDSVVCKNGLLNPYAKEVQFALQYFLTTTKYPNKIKMTLNYFYYTIMTIVKIWKNIFN